jgi:hypothetical protein
MVMLLTLLTSFMKLAKQYLMENKSLVHAVILVIA